MAYVSKRTWWLSGPSRGMGQIPGSLDPVTGDSYAFGLSGLGQTCSDGSTFIPGQACPDGGPPVCPAGSTLGNTGPLGSWSCVPNPASSGGAPNVCNTLMPSAMTAAQLAACYPGTTQPACPLGQTCSIPGVPNTYLYIGLAALAAFVLMGMRH